MKVSITVELHTVLRIAAFLDQYAENCAIEADNAGDKQATLLQNRAKDIGVYRQALLTAVDARKPAE